MIAKNFRRRRSALRVLGMSSGAICGALAGCGGDAPNQQELIMLPAPVDGRIVLPVVAFPQLHDVGGGLVGRSLGVRDPIAVGRQDASNFVAVTAVCTHMACTLAFNSLNVTLECPCHGSTFELDGRLINGPAVQPLRVLPTAFDGQMLDIMTA
jgi:Rieske Fe-S protein